MIEPDRSWDVIVIGGGPAGMAAALEAERSGGRVLILERNNQLGGILPQCIHNGFGAINFGKDLPGPEYAWRYEQMVQKTSIGIMLDTMVVELNRDLDVYAINEEKGYLHFRPRAVVLAMGCRERTRAQIRLPGTRAAGIFTAGTVQRLVNIEGYMPGRKVVILGSGDIGMIMARRLTIEGADVLGVLELMPYLTGLRRNYVQCLEDYGIPLHLSTTVKRIIGNRRVEGIETMQVDSDLQPVPGSEEIISCDTLVLSVGLIPENELSDKAGVILDGRSRGPHIDSAMATSVPGIFAAGNVTGIYDLVDYVSKAGEVAGRNAANWAERAGEEDAELRWKRRDDATVIPLKPGKNVGMVLPQEIRLTTESPANTDDPLLVMLRPQALMEYPVKVRFMSSRNPTGKPTGEPAVALAEQYARPSEMIIRELKDRHRRALLDSGASEITVELQ